MAFSFPRPHASLICTTSRVFMDESSSADAIFHP
jgi:hypothetical protein